MMSLSFMALLPVIFLSAGLIALLNIQRASKRAVNNKKHKRLGRLLSPLAWLMIFIGVMLSVNHFGPEFGIAIALSQISLLAALLLLSRANFKTPSDKAEASEYLPLTSAWKAKLALFFIAGPYCIATTCAISLAISLLLPISTISQMAFAAIFYPTLLGLISFLICFRKKIVLDAGYLTVAAALSLICIYF